jgi:hypothetical protein
MTVVRIDFRPVPDILSHVQFNRLKEYLKKHGFDNDYKNYNALMDNLLLEPLEGIVS